MPEISNRNRRIVHLLSAVTCSAVILCSPLAFAQEANSDWPYYAGTLGSARYSPLDQITPENVGDLTLAWKWDSADEALKQKNDRLRPGYFKITPLVVDGVMYTSTALSQIAAIDPGTGETLWVHDPEAYLRPGARRMFQHRGLAYWTDGTKKRIVIATGTRQLITIDAKTGKRDMTFGTDGWVDLGKGFDPPIIETQIYYSAPPLIVRDTIIVGGSMADEASNPGLPRGNIRAYDVRTGKHKWTFNIIPVAGEYGVETWENDSWKNTGAANVWSMMSADEELGYVYFPTGTPANDFYGGHRLGDTLFAESIVCVDVESGERVWHFQGVHHGLWDYDFPAAPILVDITVDGKDIKALAQVSKQGFTYVFDRVTGKPVWPIEERPVPQSTVPGERTSPTQPFPTKPPPFELQGLTEDDLIDFTPELRQEALDFVKDYTIGPLFTPPSLITDMDTGAGATLQSPSAAGGANWGSAGVDLETGILYVQSGTDPSLAGIIKASADRSSFNYLRGGPWAKPARPSGLFLTKPPYGRITAIDLNKGEILWQVPHGEGPRDHPLLKDLNLPRLGSPSNAMTSNSGPVITKTLVIYSHVEVLPGGRWSEDKRWLIAYDKQNGDVLWQEKLAEPPYAVPMTYMHKGKQYIAVGVGGAAEPGGILAYALP